MSRYDDSSNGKAGGISFSGLLQIAFIILKLCHVIDWPWIWVLSPIWISLAIVIIIIVGAITIEVISDKRKKGK